MKKIFLTGATGFIGERLALRLAGEGHTVHALVRDPGKAKRLTHPQIVKFAGDLADEAALREAMSGCEEAYHLAALAKVWDKNPNAFFEVNVLGTRRVLDAALAAGVSRVVVTSTAGTVGPSSERVPLVSEASERQGDFFTDYEATKHQSELEIAERSRQGQHVVVVNPTRVYGPGFLSDSNAVTMMITRYVQGKWRIIPGDGHKVGNYVFVEDVVEGHLLAMAKGRAGERYLLAGENASYNDFFAQLAEVSGRNYRLFKLPVGVLMTAAQLMVLWNKLSGAAPLITPNWVRKYLYHWRIDHSKATRELGYSPMSLREGIGRTVNWFEKEQQKP